MNELLAVPFDTMDSEKHLRVYTSAHTMARHGWRVDKAPGQNTQKSECMFRCSPIRCSNKKLRVYMASDANWLRGPPPPPPGLQTALSGIFFVFLDHNFVIFVYRKGRRTWSITSISDPGVTMACPAHRTPCCSSCGRSRRTKWHPAPSLSTAGKKKTASPSNQSRRAKIDFKKILLANCFSSCLLHLDPLPPPPQLLMLEDRLYMYAASNSPTPSLPLGSWNP